MRRFFFILFIISGIGAYLYYVRGWDLKRLNEETLGRIPIAALHSATTTPIGARGIGTHWEEGKRTLTSRGQAGGVTIGDKIYLVGGIDGYGRTLDSLEIYDIASDTWSYGPKMPQALHHPAVTTDGKNLYVVAGLLGISSQAIDQAWMFDTGAKTWRELSRLNDFRGAASAAYINGKIYLVGGLTNAGPTASMEVYDMATGAWKEGPSMPTARTGLAVFALDGKLYAVGGTRGSLDKNFGTVEMYDTHTEKWTPLAPMHTRRSDIAAAVVNGVPYVVGGDGVSGAIETIETYDAAKNIWKTQPMVLPTARHGLTAAAWHNRLYVITGGKRSGFSVSALNDVLIVGGASIAR